MLKIRSSLLYAMAASGFLVILGSSLGFGLESISVGRQFGLFEVLPFGYWLGLGIMVSSVLLGLRNGDERLFLVQVLLIFVSLWGAAALFEKNPSVWDTYIHYLSADRIVGTGTMAASGPYDYSFNYPGFFVLSASYSSLAGEPVLLFLRFYPLFSATFMLVAMYLFVRTYVPTVHSRYALIICVLANVWFQVHFSPHSLGLASGLLVFVCLERDGFEWKLAALALFTFVVVSHPTTVMIVLGGVIAREVVIRLQGLLARPLPSARKPWPVSVFFLIWMAWLFTGAVSFSGILIDVITARLGFMIYVPEAVAGTVASRTAEDLFPIPPKIRTAVIAVLVALVALSLLIYIITRKRRDYVLPPTILALFALPFVMVPMDILFFNGQLYDRAILILVLACPIILTIVLVSRLRRRIVQGILISGLILAASFNMSTLFYNESLYIVSDEGIDASEFLSYHMADGALIIGAFCPQDVWTGERRDFRYMSYVDAFPARLGNITDDMPAAVVFNPTVPSWYGRWGITFVYEFYEKDAGNHSRVYDNGVYWVIAGG